MLPQYIWGHEVILLLLGHLLFLCTLLSSPSEKDFFGGWVPTSSPHLFSTLSDVFTHECEPAPHIHTYKSTSGLWGAKFAAASKGWNLQTGHPPGKGLFTCLWTISRRKPSLALCVVAVILSVRAVSHLVLPMHCRVCTVLSSTPWRKAFDGIVVLSILLWLLVYSCGF